MSSRLVVADAVRTPAGREGNAVLIRNGRVAAIGEHADLTDESTPEQVYAGAVIVPGIRDAHLHPVAYTAAIAGLSLKKAQSLAEVAALLARTAASLGDREPLVAVRLDDENLAEQRLPVAADLDGATGDRPCLVHRYCGHIAVANSAALLAAGVTASTPDPEGGSIDREADGRPTGVLRETAIDLVAGALAGQQRVQPFQVVAAMRGLAGLGITSIGAMLRCGGGAWAELGNEAEILATTVPGLPIRVAAYVIADDMEQLRDAADLIEPKGPLLTWNGVKRFGDGSLGGHTAAMHEPFFDQPDTRGLLRLGELDREMARASLAAGKGVAIHAIGDLACTAVIDFFEELVAAGVAGHRLRIEHASVLSETDIGRLAATGAIASVQPPFLGSETEWLEKRLGPDRLLHTYPFRSMAAAGVVLAGGSDSPVESPDPWAGIARARDRAGINPPESLDAAAAVHMYTAGGATALGEPEPLAVGSPADLIVVDRDPVTVTASEVAATTVIDTYVGGDAVDVDRSIPTWMD